MTSTLHVNLPTLYPEQFAAFFNEARYSFCEATTKGGKTLGAIVWLAHELLSDTRPLHWWWVAPVHPQAEIGYQRAKRMFRGVYDKSNDTDKLLTFPGDRRWWFKSGEKPDNLYGEDVAAAVIDEFTRLREESWWAVRSTLTATNGPIRLIGNVKGRGNWGYRLSRKAEQGTPGYQYHRITADDAVRNGVFSQEELEDARNALPHQVFRELYYCEPSDDGGNPFGLAAIEACVTPELSEYEPVAYGIDLAKSVDYTVYIGLDEFGDVCRFGRWTRPPGGWEETERKIVEEIGHVPALVDSTGVGDPIVERLERQCYGTDGYTFTQRSKQQLMEGLAYAVQHQQVGFPEGPIRQEMDTFEYEHTRTGVRYTAPEGLHDDCVCALALAVECRRRMVPASAHGFAAGEIVRARAREAMAARVDDPDWWSKARQDHDFGFRRRR